MRSPSGTRPTHATTDGTVVRSGLSSNGPTQVFAVDDTYVYYFVQTQGPLGTTTELHAAKLGRSDPEITVFSTSQEGGGSFTVAAANGYVYYLGAQTGSPPDQTQPLRRTLAGSTDANGETIAPISGLGGQGGAVIVSGKYLIFNEDGGGGTSQTLHIYDTTTGTLDPTTYDTLTGGSPNFVAAATDTELYWLAGSGSEDVYKATIPGGTKAATGDTFTQQTMILGMGVSASGAVMFSTVQGKGYIFNASSPQPPIASWTGTGGAGGSYSVVFTGPYAYYSAGVTGTAEPLMRVSLADGTSTTIASMSFQGSARAIGITSKYAYWMQTDSTDNSGGYTTNLRQKPLP